MSAASPIPLASDSDFASGTTPPSALERRAHARLRLDELPWVTGVRLRYGPPVSLIDLSPGGAQIDTASYRLQPGANLVVEIAGADTHLTVRSKVVRCEVSAIAPQTFYRGAVAFECPLNLPVVSSSSSAADFVAARTPDAGHAFAEWKRIVARFDDGRLLRGFCRDFLPIGGAVNVWALPDAPQHARISIPVHRLRAIDFLDESAINAGSQIRTDILEEGRSDAENLIVTFRDGQVLTGTLEHHEPEVGFFLTLDAPNQEGRTFVFSHAIDRVELLHL
jgi:PilZ domain